MLAVASIALSTCVGLVLRAKDLVMWDTNSTEMPTACKQHRVQVRKLRNDHGHELPILYRLKAIFLFRIVIQ